MTNKINSNEDESLAKTVHDLEGMVARQDDMIQDLVRLIRMQNSEINTILQQQNKQGKEHERQHRRVSGIVDKLSSRLSSFLNDQAAAADINKDQAQRKEAPDPDLIFSLIAKVDALDSTLRDHKQSPQETLQRQVDALEARIDSLQDQISLNNKTNEETICVNTEDLQSLTETIAKGQIAMQLEIETFADTLNRRVDIISEHKSDIQSQGNNARLSQKVPNHPSKTSKDMQVKLEPDSIESIHRLPDISADGDTPSFSSLDLQTPSQISDSLSIGREPRDDDAENCHRQLASPNSKTSQGEESKTTKQDKHPFYSKDILNLKLRLSYAEKLIGARYRTGTFSIRGRSFYQDATALRYNATDQHARDTFKMFYGDRLHAIHYVDVAPPAVIAAFDIVARVRCRHEMWTDDKLEVKRQIRCAAEQIADDWIKSLPLRESDEYNLDILSRRLQKQFNILKILCYRNSVEFDFALPAV